MVFCVPAASVCIAVAGDPADVSYSGCIECQIVVSVSCGTKVLCFDRGKGLREALAVLETASRHFGATICAPGSIASTQGQWALDQTALHSAFEHFLVVLVDFVCQLRSAETPSKLAALQPAALLGAPFEAIEAVYPDVVTRRQQDEERIAR